MSNVDKRALREAAEKAISEEGETWWSEEQLASDYGLALHKADAKFIAAANPATVLTLLDELEAAEERYEDMLRQARSFREAHDSASEIIRQLERNKLVVKLPTTKLWAGKVACYEASEIIELLFSAGIRIQGED
ncbi:ead/Ea22-like family protein [Enterobacter hormaechei]|uniref:ead/Ea22-like family protein n=1 Tax=Enterobacter hormaechei TaxID=158836 RepID=UPI003F4226F7